MAKKDLWGASFDIPTKEDQTSLLQKVESPIEVKAIKSRLSSKKVSIEEKLEIIKSNVYRILGRYKDDTIVIRTKDELVSYIDKAIENGIIAIDTETNNSLDPITCKLMGGCIYTPTLKQAYIPINHIDYKTGQRLDWQLTEQDIKEQFDRLSNTKIIMHNAKFDYEVIKCTCNCKLKVYWDTSIGAFILNENEETKLKIQYKLKIDPTQEKYSIDHLFEGLEYAIVDPQLFALYAATDAYMTLRLYQYQRGILDRKENERLLSLILNIEVPVVEVTAEMELNGVCVDVEYNRRLSKKYNDRLDELDKLIQVELSKYNDIVSKWRLTKDANYHKIGKDGKESKSKAEQLQTPINLSSPIQLSILLYDILNVPIVDKDNPRGTGEDIIAKIDLPICRLIKKRRELLKIISTYIDNLPKLLDIWQDGRVHTTYRPLGAKTGRFSSGSKITYVDKSGIQHKDIPGINMQNIPSHNKEIRRTYKARDGYVLVGADYSQQEPRILCQYAKDENMINAYKEKKDLYATIASIVHNNGYWDNMEKHEDGSPNPEGKKRRGAIKSVVLGILYGSGAPTVAEQITDGRRDKNGNIDPKDVCTPKEAQEIIDKFYKGFPKVKNWIDETKKFAMTKGYTEDLYGRRRRLPDLLLPRYDISLKEDNSKKSFNPLLNINESIVKEKPKIVLDYEKQFAQCKSFRDSSSLKKKAEQDGLAVVDNGGFISKSERQCVNALCQGAAASMTKKAMIAVYNDKELIDLNFHLAIAVHDELIGECPQENAERVAKRLSELMLQSALPEVLTPMKCDTEATQKWYDNDYFDVIVEEYKDKQTKMTKEKALESIIQEHTESTKEELLSIIGE